MKFEVNSNNKIVKAIADGTAPRPAQMAAAKGVLPLQQADLLEALVILARGADEEIAGQADRTISSQDDSSLTRFLADDEVAPLVLDFFAVRKRSSHKVCEAVISNPNTPVSSIIELARGSSSGQLLELLSFNQQLLIGNPEIIEAIIANPNRNAEAERRASEIKREFFEKERGAEQIARELRAQGKDAAAEFIENAEFADELAEGDSEGGISVEDAILLAEHIEVPDADVDDTWLSLEYIEEIYEETDAQREANVKKILGELTAEDDDITGERISMISRIMKMSMRDRMRLAMKGDREARTLLIRDPNKIISTAVIQNPKITDQEIEKIAAMRTVNSDVLRLVAINRNWARSYKIIHTLVLNPRTPLPNSMSILPRLQMKDLFSLSKNKNVPEAVRKNALRISSTRKGR